MQPLATGRLAETDKTKLIQTVAEIARRLDHSGKGNVGARVEIKDQTARQFRLTRMAIPGMKFE